VVRPILAPGLQCTQVCQDGFSNAAATVCCKQLGLLGPGVAVGRAFYGAGSGPIWLDDVSCVGNEPDLDSCSHSEWGRHNW